jgi:hypothetical protein
MPRHTNFTPLRESEQIMGPMRHLLHRHHQQAFAFDWEIAAEADRDEEERDEEAVVDGAEGRREIPVGDESNFATGDHTASDSMLPSAAAGRQYY